MDGALGMLGRWVFRWLLWFTTSRPKGISAPSGWYGRGMCRGMSADGILPEKDVSYWMFLLRSILQIQISGARGSVRGMVTADCVGSACLSAARQTER